MGFFSKTCAKTHMPIVSNLRGYPRFHHVAALRPNGEIFKGVYDGYGRVGDVELTDDWEEVKLVLLSNYDNETFHDLGKSKTELGQGWFMDDQFLLFCSLRDSFKSYAEYKKYFKKYANWL